MKRQEWTVARVAKALHRSENFVRAAMRQGKLPFGVAVRMEEEWAYAIYQAKAREYLGSPCPDGALNKADGYE